MALTQQPSTLVFVSKFSDFGKRIQEYRGILGFVCDLVKKLKCLIFQNESLKNDENKRLSRLIFRNQCSEMNFLMKIGSTSTILHFCHSSINYLICRIIRVRNTFLPFQPPFLTPSLVYLLASFDPPNPQFSFLLIPSSRVYALQGTHDIQDGEFEVCQLRGEKEA